MINFPQPVILVLPFFIRSECWPIPHGFNQVIRLKITFSYIFTLFSSLALHAKRLNLQLLKLCLQCCHPRIPYSILKKTCCLYGQILITCLKCSEASFHFPFLVKRCPGYKVVVQKRQYHTVTMVCYNLVNICNQYN